MCDATSNTMRHYGEKAIMKGGKIAFFKAKELIQESDGSIAQRKSLRIVLKVVFSSLESSYFL